MRFERLLTDGRSTCSISRDKTYVCMHDYIARMCSRFHIPKAWNPLPSQHMFRITFIRISLCDTTIRRVQRRHRCAAVPGSE